MSAAQPADPPHPHTPTLNGPDDAAVIPLDQHRGPRGVLRAVRERWSPMGNHTEDHDQVHPLRSADQQPDNGVPALEAFASSIETSFLEIGQSLTDPSTAATFQRTLDVWERILEGSHAQHVIDDQQLAQLLETLHGMRQAPTLL